MKKGREGKREEGRLRLQDRCNFKAGLSYKVKTATKAKKEPEVALSLYQREDQQGHLQLHKSDTVFVCLCGWG